MRPLVSQWIGFSDTNTVSASYLPVKRDNTSSVNTYATEFDPDLDKGLAAIKMHHTQVDLLLDRWAYFHWNERLLPGLNYLLRNTLISLLGSIR